MDNRPIKPICLRKREALAEITDCINRISERHKLSFSDLDDILFRINSTVAKGLSAEIAAAEKNYDNLINEFEKNLSNNEEVTDNGIEA